MAEPEELLALDNRSAAEAQGFWRLPSVKAVRPRLPEDPFLGEDPHLGNGKVVESNEALSPMPQLPAAEYLGEHPQAKSNRSSASFLGEDPDLAKVAGSESDKTSEKSQAGGSDSDEARRSEVSDVSIGFPWPPKAPSVRESDDVRERGAANKEPSLDPFLGEQQSDHAQEVEESDEAPKNVVPKPTVMPKPMVAPITQSFSVNQGEDLQALSPPPPAVSPAIGALLKQLADQHLLELATARSQLAVHTLQLPPYEPNRDDSSSEASQSIQSQKLGANADVGESKMSNAETRPAEDWLQETPGHANRRRVSVLMAKQKDGLREVQADTVQGAMINDKEIRKEVREAATKRATKDTLQELLPEAVKSDETMTSSMEVPRSTLLQRTKKFLQSNRYEFTIAILLCVNVLWMAVELQLFGNIVAHDLGLYQDTFLTNADLRGQQEVFNIGDLIFTIVFALDVVIRIVVLKREFWAVKMNYLDVVVTIISVIEVVVVYSTVALLEEVNVNPVLFRLLRLGKLARAVRMVTMNSVLNSLQILTRCLASSTTMLFWSFCLLTFFQCVFGLVASTLCRDFITDPRQDLQLREEVFLYFGTFTRTFLTMFEILFANWAVPCRLLMENISEWFSTFFLVYRCLLGFAVLNVVNAVFVQQTMKVASSDEELAFKQKERELASYTRKVKKLFQTMDQSGDGAINFEEFSKLVQSPMLQFLLSQLDLEYHDLLSLFEFLDNGDGQITLTEFIDGAAKLRGSAKALDIWRMETKLEVLFGEVLSALKGHTDVRDVFDKLQLKHLTFTTSSRILGSSESETCDKPQTRATASL